MRRFRRLVPVIVLAGLLALAGEVSACPNCKEALAAQTGDAAPDRSSSPGESP